MTATQTWRDVSAETDFVSIPDVADDVSQAIQPQYAHAPKMRAFTKVFQEVIDATEQMESICAISDIEQAEGIFLDWIGGRVGVPRQIRYQGDLLELDDILYRGLIKWKLARNISASDARSLNVLIETLIGVKAPIVDVGAMTLALTVKEEISGDNLVLLRKFAPEIKPAGVGVIFMTSYASILGFNGQELSTFNFGVFNPNPI